MPNPFERFFNPDREGTFSGTLGRAFGVPTEQERFGDLTGKANAELSKRVEGGMSPQQAILDYVQTPEGLQLFQNPNGMKVLQEWTTNVTPPDPKFHNAPPGTTVFETQGGRKTNMYTTPTADVQRFKEFQDIAQLPEQDLKNLASVWMQPEGQRQTAAERAIRELISKSLVSPEIGLKLIGGVLEVKEAVNTAGEKTGMFTIIDKSNPQSPNIQVIAPGKVSDGSIGAAHPTPDNPKGIKDPLKTTMFFDNGIIPSSLGWLDSTIRQLIGSEHGSERLFRVRERQRYLTQLETAVSLMPEGDGKTNLIIEQMKKLLPRLYSDDPRNAVSAGIQLHDLASQELAADENVTIKTYPKDQVLKAARRREGWHTILRALPDRADMTAIEKAIIAGQSVPEAQGDRQINLKTGAQLGLETLGGVGEQLGDKSKKPPSAAAPAKPTAKPTPKQGSDEFENMSLPTLQALDVTKLNAEQRAAYLKRLQAIRGGK